MAKPPPPPPPDQQLEARVTALEATTSALDTRVTSLEDTISSSLEERVTALESTTSSLAIDVAQQQSDLIALTDRVTTLETDKPPSPLPPPTDLWTTFTASEPSGEGASFTGAGTRKVYVDSAAADDNGDGSQAHPRKTIYAGSQLLRMGFPDWLLLKKGGEWLETVQMEWSGRSADEMILISAYGSGPRPMMKGRYNIGTPLISMGNRPGGDFIAIVGIEFYAYDRDPANPEYNAATADDGISGIVMLNPFHAFLIEDCKLSFFNDNISQAGTLGGPWSYDLRIRNNIITDCYTITHKASGIHTYMVSGLVVEGNVFDHNGYLEGVSENYVYQYNHNIYISAAAEADPSNTIDDSIVFRNNIMTRDASGAQLRTGGTFEDNLWARSPYPYSFALPNTGLTTIRREVVIEGAANAGQNFNWGIMGSRNIPPYDRGSVALSDVIVANSVSKSTNSVGIQFEGPAEVFSAVDCVVFNWPAPALTAPAGANTTGSIFDAEGANTAGFVDPHRSIAGYHASLGREASFESFIAEARKQSKENWRPEYTAKAVCDYIRAGFT